MRFDQHFLRTALPDAELIGQQLPAYPAVAIDSRRLRPGEIFVALPGAKTDGHQFLRAALTAGCAGLIIAKAQRPLLTQLDQQQLAKIIVCLVPEPQAALLQLAQAWRKLFTGPVVGITGSVGKTSTKELLSQILQAAAVPHCVSPGNLNTLIGASISLLQLQPQHQVAVLELGISRRGEMAALADLVRPTMAIITTIGHSHMGQLGLPAEVSAEKRQIFKFFTETNIGIINGDNPHLAQIAYPHPMVRFGRKTTNQVQARKVVIENGQLKFTLKIYGTKIDLILDGTNPGRISNSLAAAAAAYLLEIPISQIIAGLQQELILPGRMQRRQLRPEFGGGRLIDDCYNAGPESVKAAILAFEKLTVSGAKVLVLGDMFELGRESQFWHRQIGRFLHKIPSLQRLILVGEAVKFVKQTAPVTLAVDLVADWQAAVPLLQTYLQPADVVLVKGSTYGYTAGLMHLVQRLAEPLAPLTQFKPAVTVKEAVY